MGSRGPAPTPTAILKVRGSWRAKTRKGEPKPQSEAPGCPSWLSKEAKAEWKRQADALDGLKILTKCDRSALTIYCEAWAEFVQAVEKITATGMLITRPSDKAIIANPLLAIRNKAAARVLSLAGQFGFTPSARTRLRATEEGLVPNQNDSESKARFFKFKA